MYNKRLLILLLLFSLHGTLHAQQSWELRGFTKPVAANPVMGADSTYLFYCPMKKETVQWQKADVFNPAAVVRKGKVYLLFRAEDIPGTAIGMRTSRIGIAVSDDGLHFKKFKEPVLYPDSGAFSHYDNPGGCEDPRIVEKEDGSYVLLYTSWNRQTARLSVAVSKDLFHWEKKGPAFQNAYGGELLSMWSKSGSIVTQLKNGRLIAAKLQGKYWMYWGENPMYIASSPDLVDWTPMLDSNGMVMPVLTGRKNKFDSQLTEPGPPALLTDKGIVLIYNGKNIENEDADPAIPRGAYCTGQVLFDPKHPEKVLARCDNYFLKPDLPHEVSGQYKAGTTFAEGLVYFKGKWLLYYGTADSMVGVAERN